MNFIVIRHGETDLNKEERLQGSQGPNVGLTEEGRNSVEKLGKSLMVTPAHIYTSPLIRAQETTAILSKYVHAPISLTPELQERDFGTLSGKLRSEIAPKLIEDDLEGHYDYRPYGGEKAEDVRGRILRFLATLPLESIETIMLVTHRGIIRILYDLFPAAALPEVILPASKHFFEITKLPVTEPQSLLDNP